MKTPAPLSVTQHARRSFPLLVPALVIISGLSLLSPIQHRGFAQAPELIKPSREMRTLRGWTLAIDRRLLADAPEAVATALTLLEAQLEEISLRIPAPALAKLQKIPLYFSPPYPGETAKAEYHPGAGWLKEHGRDPAMVKGVEFTNIARLPQETKRMPNFTLHELAHGFHDRELQGGFKNLEIDALYQKARSSGTYEKVQRWNGEAFAKTPERAYAMTNPMEYFAENTEAFFSRNDFFPFNRTELVQHDPEMAALIGRLWGVPTADR